MSYKWALEGYDIYLTNNSGVLYSQEHEYLTVEDCEFWKKDWVAWGSYDMPAAIREI